MPPPPLQWYRAGVDVDSDAEDKRTDGPDGYVYSCLFVLPTLLFFSLVFFLVISFAAKSTVMSWAGQGGTNPGGGRNVGPDGGGGQKMRILLFFFSLYPLFYVLFFLPYSLMFFFYNDLFLRDVYNIV